MKMLLGFFLLALTFIAAIGCEETPKAPILATGTVRAVAGGYDRCHWSVVIEGDNGVIWTVGINNCRIPPVWAGLHGQFEYDAADFSGYSSYLVVRKRLN